MLLRKLEVEKVWRKTSKFDYNNSYKEIKTIIKMIEKLATYNVVGDYFFKGQIGSQIGVVSHFSDNKIIGIIGDNNSGGKAEHQKLFLGKYFPENNKISFLKLAKNPFLMPVIWSIENKEPSQREDISGTYNGIWYFVESLPPEVGIIELGFLTDCLDLDKLINIPISKLEDSILRQEVMNMTELLGASQGYIGHLEFTLKKD